MHKPSSTYRSDATQAKYEEYLQSVPENGSCVLCPKPTKHDFTYWRIVENSFPYDRIAVVHDLLLPKAHKTEDELTDEEWREYKELQRGFIDDHYQYVLIPTTRNKSQPSHFHTHLMIGN